MQWDSDVTSILKVGLSLAILDYMTRLEFVLNINNNW